MVIGKRSRVFLELTLVAIGLIFGCAIEGYASMAPFAQDSGPDGIVSIESEDFLTATASSTHQWVPVSPSGYSGQSALQTIPNTGVNKDTGYVTGSPQLQYRVKFTKTGTHYFWGRGIGLSGNDDSFHAGLDGQAISTSDRISFFATSLSWSKKTMDNNAPATFNVASAGEHTVNVWMREDGFILDKIVITTNASYVPSGSGPAESPRVANTAPAVNAGADQTITLPSNSVTLYGRVTDDGLPNPPAAVTTQWSKVSGTGETVFGTAPDHSITAAFSIDGVYILRLTVNDGELEAIDDITVTVLPPPDTTPPDVVLTSPTLTNNSNYTLSYTVDEESFSELISLSEGGNLITRSFTDKAGNRTDVNWTITLDSIPPSGSVVINAGALTTSDPLVILGLAASDSGSGIGQVRFSADLGISWTVWENFTPSRQISLPAGDGSKEVRYQVQDIAANSAVFSDTITLQTIPSGSAAFFDDFNRTGLGPNWTVIYGGWSVSSNMLRHGSTSGGSIKLNVPLSSGNYEAEANFEYTSYVGGNHRGILLRHQNNQNFYYGQHHRHNAKFRIIRVQNGVWTTLAETPAPGITNYTYHKIRFKAEGSALQLYFDNVLKVQASDTQFSSGAVGIYSQVYGHKMDDFRVTTFNSQPPSPVALDPFSSPINQTEITLSGTKEPDTAVLVNGSVSVPIVNLTVWQADIFLPAEGENRFSITARNASGLESAPVAVTIVRDTVPPEIQFTRPAPGAYVNQPQTLVYGTVDGVEFSMIAELEEGNNVVTKTAVDPAGNVAEAQLPLVLDTVPPSIEVISPSNNAWVTNAQVNVHYDCEDDKAVCSSHEVSLELEHEGANEITVVHTDLAGNIGFASHVIRLDSVAPEIIFTSHGEGKRIRSTQEIIRYTVDGMPGSLIFPLSSEGENVCQIIAEDPAGNFTIAALTLVRDTTPPGFTVTFPQEGTYINRAEVVLP